jgi:hypothetical protein
VGARHPLLLQAQQAPRGRVRRRRAAPRAHRPAGHRRWRFRRPDDEGRAGGQRGDPGHRVAAGSAVGAAAGDTA